MMEPSMSGRDWGGVQRTTRLWMSIFNDLKNSKKAPKLIRGLTHLHRIDAPPPWLDAVHAAYDHMVLFGILGNSIHGEDTEGTRRVADVLYHYWDEIRDSPDTGII